MSSIFGSYNLICTRDIFDVFRVKKKLILQQRDLKSYHLQLIEKRLERRHWGKKSLSLKFRGKREIGLNQLNPISRTREAEF
jgi:hypothetical protein